MGIFLLFIFFIFYFCGNHHVTSAISWAQLVLNPEYSIIQVITRIKPLFICHQWKLYISFQDGPGTITTSSNNPSVKLGEHLKIICHADGNPKPTILWFKEETEPALQSQNEELIINNASWSQAGWYRCNASNAVGSLQMRIKVTVLGGYIKSGWN